ncbi:uncharacterized protein LOC113504628 [Trichoplusia ni]|uniref:ascorbate ferrireductase (transmembrane) n=1 Tax=Trichoplusia ni TaxID=7111 RepID=A0A7E5WQ14_TRINI|nr:uncharacterized protein LOC113504628 [Trichoplusia ni]
MSAVPKTPQMNPTTVIVENGPQNPPESPNNNEGSQFFLVIMNIINSLTHMLLGCIVISAFIYANVARASTFKQHIYLCVFGYVILMAQAVLTFNPHNGWSTNIKFPVKRKLHAVMQICGSSLAIAGTAVQMASVFNNLRSTHGIFGFIAFLLTVVSLVGGIYHLIYQNEMKGTLRFCHAIVGCLTLTSAFIALALGFDSMRNSILRPDTNTNMFIASTVLALVGTLIVSCGKIFNRRCA